MTALAPRLLACPFCGSDAEMDTDQSFRAFVSGRFESSVAIYCTKCCVQMQHCYSDHRGTEREGLAADLIERWNTREAAAALSGREAVATVCLRGETYAHGLMTELQVQHAEGVEFPIGTKFYTTPQPGETP